MQGVDVTIVFVREAVEFLNQLVPQPFFAGQVVICVPEVVV